MFPFDPPENIRKPKVFCFQGDQKGTLGSKGLIPSLRKTYGSHSNVFIYSHPQVHTFCQFSKIENFFKIIPLVDEKKLVLSS